ncbi:MAG: PP2C family protein-serine/threonine phosphatase [Lachnospiraceae bacterium]|nr:PP2C family protein-serine/threonine phosphatase [Lachnospiraceae bacterium]
MRRKRSLRQKSVLVILVFTLALAIASTAVSYQMYADSMDAHYKSLSENVANTAISVLDTEMVKHYTELVTEIYLKNPAPDLADEEEEAAYLAQYEALQDEGYEELYQTLVKIRAASDVLSLYIIYVDADSRTCVYVVDGDDTQNACLAGTWDIIYEQNYGIFEDPARGFPAYITNTEEYGWLCSTGVAVLDEDGSVLAYVMVDTSMDQVMRERYDYLARISAVLLVITALQLLFFLNVVNRTVVKPINRLAQAASSYVSTRENADAQTGPSLLAKIDIHTGDEVENLADAMKQMEQDINGYIENLTAVTAEKERIGAELDIARHIQSSMLPCIFPAFPDREEFDIYATMDPAKEVGGDFYDFFMVDDRHLAVVMADVSGKGIPAALFMVIGKTLIKDHTQPGISLGSVFASVNNLLCDSNSEGMFITAFEGVLDLMTGEFAYVNAGHEVPYLCRKGETFEPYKVRAGFVLAGMEDIPYREGKLTLEPGDRIFLYTDGVPEATNADNQMFGMERMRDTLNRNRALPPEQLLPAIKEATGRFVGEAPQFDDLTMLCLEYRRPMR